MYSINVFLTFSLSMYSMLHFWYQHRGKRPYWKRRLVLFGAGLVLCVTILGITLFEKFAQGGWITIVITLVVIGACFWIRRHYRAAHDGAEQLYRELGDFTATIEETPRTTVPLDPRQPTAAILVDSYSGVGIHTVLNVFRSFPGHFKNVVFLSVGVVDSGEFKGEHALDDLQEKTASMLRQYVILAGRLGLPATSRLAIGTEVVAAAEKLCLETTREFPLTTFFTGKLIFQKERWWQRLLHNETALAIQKRLQWAGKTMVSMPIRVRET
jgi:hypothetical protein